MPGTAMRQRIWTPTSVGVTLHFEATGEPDMRRHPGAGRDPETYPTDVTGARWLRVRFNRAQKGISLTP